MAKKTNRKTFLNRNSSAPAEKSVVPGSLLNTPSIGLSLDIEMSEDEENNLEALLREYSSNSKDSTQSLKEDLSKLKSLTTEIKSIAAQSVILHGERIKRAQLILTKYREGIFTKWLMQTYGNRTTPYSMLHYYNLYSQLNNSLKAKLKLMPKKAAYILAIRAGELPEKEQIVDRFENQSQKDLIALIQRSFPVPEKDKRKKKAAQPLSELVSELLDCSQKIYLTEEKIPLNVRKKIEKGIELLRKALESSL